MAAPTVWVGVVDVDPRQQRPALLQQFNDRLIRRENFFAFILRQSIVQPPRSIHVAGRVQPVSRASIKIVRAVRRSGMNRARACIRSHVVREYTQNAALQKWMLKCRALQFSSRKTRNLFRILEPNRLGHRFRKRFRDDIHLPIGFQCDIFKIRMKCHRQRSWQRPRSCGPDDGVHLLASQGCIQRPWIARHPIAHIYAGAGVHFIFHFRFGQRRAVVDAPVHRLQSLVDKSRF